MIDTLICFLMNAAVFYGAVLLTERVFKPSCAADYLISVFVLYLAQIVGMELLLGEAGKLYLGNVILLTVLLTALIFISTRSLIPKRSFPDKRFISELLNNKVILLAASLLAGFASIKILINLLNPPFGWDSITYQLVFPVNWLKHGNLCTPISVFGDPSPPYYPLTGGLFFLWLILPLRDVFLADAGQFPFLVLSFVSVYGILRKFRVDPESSFMGAALFVITPNVFKQIELSYVDLMLAGLFLAALNFLLSFAREVRFRDFLLWAVSFGLFLGVKTSALVYGLFPVLFFLLVLFFNSAKIGPVKSLGYAAGFLLICSLTGAWAYIRNAVETGNPLYPAQITLFGKVVFKGVMTFFDYRNRWTSAEFSFGKLLFGEGLGAQFIIFCLPAAIFAPVWFISRKGRLAAVSEGFACFLPAVLAVSFWYCMPQLWVRYLYPFLGSAFIAAFLILGRSAVPVNILRIITVICLLASAGELSGKVELAASLLLSLLSFFSLPRIMNIKPRIPVCLIFALLLLVSFGLMRRDYLDNEIKRYSRIRAFRGEEKEAWEWGYSNLPLNSRMAYSGSFGLLPFFGKDFSRELIYVSVNSVHPAKLHYFKGSRYIWGKDARANYENLMADNNYRQKASFSDWMANLRKEKISQVIVARIRDIDEELFPVEDEWMRAHPGNFRLLFANSGMRIYEFIPFVQRLSADRQGKPRVSRRTGGATTASG